MADYKHILLQFETGALPYSVSSSNQWHIMQASLKVFETILLTVFKYLKFVVSGSWKGKSCK